jgi:ParB-like chromosome segregation protein Spo0J
MKHLHELKVQYVSTKGVKPDLRNARTHSKKQVEQIAASIEALGFANPLLIDEDAVLIAGHGRLAARPAAGRQ